MPADYLWLLFAALFIVSVCLPAFQLEETGRASFDERFPPISEDEFLALCRPGTPPAVALTVRRVISESLCVEYERIYPSSRLAADLGAE